MNQDKIEQIVKQGLSKIYEDETFINDVYNSHPAEYNAVANAGSEAQLKELQETTDEEMLLTEEEYHELGIVGKWSSTNRDKVAKAQLAKASLHYNAKLEALKAEIERLNIALEKFEKGTR